MSKHCVVYDGGVYGPYDSWAKACFFAAINFGLVGWSIYKDE